MTDSRNHDDEVFKISITTNRKAIGTLLETVEVKLSDESIQALAREISSAIVQLQEAPRSMTPTERAIHANYAGQKPPTEFGLLVGTREVAKLLNVSSRTLWRMYNSGEMPQPIRIGRAIRWSYAEVQAWVGSGCPAMDRWKYEHDKK